MAVGTTKAAIKYGVQQFFHSKPDAIKVARQRRRPLISISNGKQYFVAAPRPFRFNLKATMQNFRQSARWTGTSMPKIIKAR